MTLLFALLSQVPEIPDSLLRPALQPGEGAPFSAAQPEEREFGSVVLRAGYHRADPGRFLQEATGGGLTGKAGFTVGLSTNVSWLRLPIGVVMYGLDGGLRNGGVDGPTRTFSFFSTPFGTHLGLWVGKSSPVRGFAEATAFACYNWTLYSPPINLAETGSEQRARGYGYGWGGLLGGSVRLGTNVRIELSYELSRHIMPLKREEFPGVGDAMTFKELNMVMTEVRLGLSLGD